jgi:hypothetical protein
VRLRLRSDLALTESLPSWLRPITIRTMCSSYRIMPSKENEEHKGVVSIYFDFFESDPDMVAKFYSYTHS